MDKTEEMSAGQGATFRDPDSARHAIRADGLSKTFERDGLPLPTLRDVNFHARDGEFVSIIGPSGCGKSTLLNIIAGLDEPTSGWVSLYDRGECRAAGLGGVYAAEGLAAALAKRTGQRDTWA